MAVLSSRLVISLMDRVSGPARRIQSAVQGLSGIGGRRGQLALGTAGTRAAMAANNRVLNNSAGLGTAAISTGLVMMGRAGFEAAYQLEKVLNNLEAVGDSSAEQRAQLKAYIQDLNSLFPFTNKEIGEAATMLFKAGLNYTQAVAALPGVLQLAQAGDIGRQEASDIATNIMTAMRLPRETTEQVAASMQRVNDVLAYAANRSNTDVLKLGETFKYVAPIAAAAGMSIEQVAAAAMTMANNGIKGSEAGVAMRAALVRMARPTKSMMATMDRLGLNINDYITGDRKVTSGDIISGLLTEGVDASSQKAAIEKMLEDKVLALKPAQLVANLVDLIAKESEGAADRSVLAKNIGDTVTSTAKTYDLIGFTKALREKGVGVGEIARIMDVRQGARVLTLLLDDLAALTDRIQRESKGSAKKMADTRIQGIVGQLMKLEAVWNNFWVTVGDSGVLAAIGKAFEGLTAGLKSLSKSNPRLLEWGTYALMAVAVAGPLGIALMGIASTAALVGALVKGASLALLLLATAPIAALPAMLVALGAAARSAALGLWLFSAASLTGKIALLGTSLLAAGGAVLAMAGGLARLVAMASPVGAVLTAIAAAGVFLWNNWQGLTAFIAGIGEGFMEGLGPARPVVEGIATGLGNIFAWFTRITGPLDASQEKWKSWGRSVGEAIAYPIRQLAELASWIGRITGAGAFGAWAARQLGLTSTAPATAPGQPAKTAGTPVPASLAKTGTSVPVVTPATPAPGASQAAPTPSGVESLRNQAQIVPVTVRDSMAEVKRILSGVDLEADGERIMQTLASGIRRGGAHVRAAVQQAATAQIQSAVRGAYSDAGR